MFRYLALIAACMLAVACGGPSDPDQRSADWDAADERARSLTGEGRHAEAIAVGEDYLNRHPGTVDGHLMVADAALNAAKAATDASRQPRFEQAATNYGRVVELSRNPILRLVAMVGAIGAYGPKGLNRFDEAERMARRLVAEDARDINMYGPLVSLLTDAKRFPQLVTVFDDIRATAVLDAKSTATYGGMVHDLVSFTDGVPPDAARSLLAGAVSLVGEQLATDSRSEPLLNTKGMLLRAQAVFETDPARQQALSAQSRATFDELDKLKKQ